MSADANGFGDYELLDAGREGGMGWVYRARQISLNRTVALKMMRGSVFSSPVQAQRFRLEAEAVAGLDHPGVVPIYDVGEHDGRQYFAMKWIEGGNLADALRNRKHGGEAALSELSTPHSALRISQLGYPPREAAELIAKVARAVHHAHQRGIIHRDLKPSNILLDNEDRPHVSDFGLAKRLNLSAGITLSDQALGTPSYMAPEQAAGKARDVTTAADTYSLGAIFYELLTGQPPFAAETAAEAMQKTLTEEPKRPRAIVPRIPRDLETICLKCLEMEARRRYASAEALAEDLDRWLRGEPIVARPSGPVARTLKWARRKPAIAALATSLVLAILAGFVAASWQLRQTERARQQSQDSLNKLRVVVTKYLSLVADNSRAKTDPARLREELMQTTVSLLEGFTGLSSTDSFLERQRGLAYLGLYRIQTERSDAAAALNCVRQAESILAALVRLDPGSVELRTDLASADLALGSQLLRRSEFDAAEIHLSRALEQCQRLVAEVRDPSTVRRQLANSCNRLSDLFVRQNRPDEAVAIQREGVRAEEALLADFPNDWEVKVNLAIDYNSLARSLAMAHVRDAAEAASLAARKTVFLTDDPARQREAEATYCKATELYEPLVTERPAHEGARDAAARCCLSFGSLLGATGRTADGLVYLEKALTHYEVLAAQFPQRPGYQQDVKSTTGKIERLRAQAPGPN